MNPLLHALIMENYRIYNIDLAKALGSINASIFLSEILGRYKFHLKNSPDEMIEDKDGIWFFFTQEKAYDRLGLSRKEQDTAIKILIEKGVISKKQMGLPCRRYFMIHEEEIVKLMNPTTVQTRLSETDKLGCPKRANLDDRKGQTAHISKEHKEEQKKDMSPAAPKSSSKSSKEEEILHYGEFESVLLTQSEYDRLVKQYGKELVNNTIESMDLIAADLKEKTFRHRYSIKSPTYNLALRRWIKRGAQEGWNSKPKNPEKTNEEYAKEIAKSFSEQKAPSMQIEIEAISTGLRIMSLHPTSRTQPTLIPYTEKGFKDQVNNALRKWRLL